MVRVGISTARLGEEMLRCSDPPLRVAWVERGNPVTQNPDTNKVREAFRALDFRVVVEQFMTDTAREADLILPAKSMFEQSDVINAYWHPYIQFKQKVLEPPGEVKPESEIYWHLAQRLSIPASRFEGVIPAPDDASVAEYLRARLRPIPRVVSGKIVRGSRSGPRPSGNRIRGWSVQDAIGKIELLSTEAAPPVGGGCSTDLPRTRRIEAAGTGTR